jgi:DNA-directed RNA polymerase subunit beta
VRDTSLRVPPGVQGIVINAKVFTRKGTERDERAKDIEDQEREKLLTNERDVKKIISESYHAKMRKLLLGRTTAARLTDDKGRALCTKGRKLDRDTLESVPFRYWRELQLEGTGKVEEKIERLASRLDEDLQAIESSYQEKIAKLAKGDELPPGVIKMV